MFTKHVSSISIINILNTLANDVKRNRSVLFVDRKRTNSYWRLIEWIKLKKSLKAMLKRKVCTNVIKTLQKFESTYYIESKVWKLGYKNKILLRGAIILFIRIHSWNKNNFFTINFFFYARVWCGWMWDRKEEIYLNFR